MLKRRYFLKKTLAFACLIAALVLFAAPSLSAQNAGTLRDVTFSQVDGKTVFLIKVEGGFTYETSLLTMPRRLVVDLTPVEKIIAPPYLQVNASGVVSVRTGQFKPQTARVVFDLNDEDFTQSISASEGSLIVSFRAGEKPFVRPVEKPAPVREIPREEISRTVDQSTPADVKRLGYFVHAAVGTGLFLKPDLAAHREFVLYGETGYVDEAYKLKNGLAYEISLGRFFRLGGSRLKAGVGFTSWTLPVDATFTMSLPHPFLTNSPRTVNFSDNSGLKKNEVSFYGFALFPLVDTDSFSVFLGPFLGYASGKILTLSDWEITEKMPFSASDVSVTNPVYFEDKISGLLFGASLSLELNLGQSLALVLDTKLNYLNPILTNLGKRANLLNLQPTLGIQFTF
jgi:hypothetical protein